MRRGKAPRMLPCAAHQAGGVGRFVLPRPILIDDLTEIGVRFADSIDLSDIDILHILAVAKSGYPIATASAMHFVRSGTGMQVFLSGVDDRAPLNTFNDLPAHGRTLTVMVDNSIHSGETAARSIKTVVEAGIRVDIFVSLVRYGDDMELAALSYICGIAPGLKVVTMYECAEIVAAQ